MKLQRDEVVEIVLIILPSTELVKSNKEISLRVF